MVKLLLDVSDVRWEMAKSRRERGWGESFSSFHSVIRTRPVDWKRTTTTEMGKTVTDMNLFKNGGSSLFVHQRSRREEIQTLSGPNEFTEFYKRLKNIRQYHSNNPSEEVRHSQVSSSSSSSSSIDSDRCSDVDGIWTTDETIARNRRWRTVGSVGRSS